MQYLNTQQNNNERIFITGCDGQIGYELSYSLQKFGNVIKTNRHSLDLTKINYSRKIIQTVKPTLIINAAAYTAVDRAETEKSLAMLLNAEVPAMLAKEAKILDIPLIHFSTDYVFDGKKDKPYEENDATNPCNIYGISKLAGEQEIINSGCNYLILRTSWIYCMRKENFLLKILKYSKKHNFISVVADQFGAPTWSRTVAEITAHIIAQSFNTLSNYSLFSKNWWYEKSGVYHLCANGYTSWYGFAQAILNEAIFPHKPKINKIFTTSDLRKAIRPVNSRMKLDKISRSFNLRIPNWRNFLKICMKDYKYQIYIKQY